MWNPIRAYLERKQKEKETAARFLWECNITSKLLPLSDISLGSGLVEATEQVGNRKRVYLATGDSLRGGSKPNMVTARMKELELEGCKWVNGASGSHGLYAVQMEGI